MPNQVQENRLDCTTLDDADSFCFEETRSSTIEEARVTVNAPIWNWYLTLSASVHHPGWSGLVNRMALPLVLLLVVTVTGKQGQIKVFSEPKLGKYLSHLRFSFVVLFQACQCKILLWPFPLFHWNHLKSYQVINSLLFLLERIGIWNSLTFPGFLYLFLAFSPRDGDRDSERISMCYDDLGCINTDLSWFNPVYRPINLLPQSRNEINTRFFLYTRAQSDVTPSTYREMTTETWFC